MQQLKSSPVRLGKEAGLNGAVLLICWDPWCEVEARNSHQCCPVLRVAGPLKREAVSLP